MAGTGIGVSYATGFGPFGTAGPKPDGTAIAPTGYRVTPAGTQTQLGNLPLNAALHPDGHHLLVTNDGAGMQSLQLVDTDTNKVIQTLPFASPESLYIGLAWSPDGKTAYASAAANTKVRVFSFADGTLTEQAPIKLPTKTPDGKDVTLFPAGLDVTPDGKKLVVADQLGDAVTVADTATGQSETVAAGHRPVWVTLSKDGRTAYVSNQGSENVNVIDVSGAAPVVSGQIKVGLHPNKSVLSADGKTLYVANGDADTVSEVNLEARRVDRTLSVAPYKNAPVGSNPTGLALDGEGKRLFVANSGNNDVAVIDLKQGKTEGLIPTAWYPTSVTWGNGRLHITNGKGLGAGPNNGPGHPNPESPAKISPDQYSGSMIQGTLSSLEVPENGELQKLTHQVKENNDPARAESEIVPRHPGDKSPIKHVIYVVKENRTYDQVLGSLGKGNGDPSLNLFGDESAPNTRELARRFTTIDNFYADAEVSANGWNWVAQANSNPYAEQMWPAWYSGRGDAPYPSESNDPENASQDPKDSYLWQRLDKASVSFANFGFYTWRKGDEYHADDPVLDAHTDHAFQGSDLSCPDSSDTFTPKKTNCLTPHVDQWLKSFRSYEAKSEMPTVQFVRFANDHTSGTRVGAPTPKAMVADNDYALGRLVDAVSHSKFWKDTVILVTEDDAQNGPDHVDAHRTLALTISPYTQTGKVDSTFYSTASMVRAIGLFAGIGPLTQFDDYSIPMTGSFTDKPNYRPYTASRPTYPMTTVNGTNAPMAAASAKQDLTHVDEIDEKTFNEAIWKSVRGADSEMPEPKHNVMGNPAATEKEGEKAKK
ncbi:beta-propeller fold lactonase family protein [Streptomyces sp. NPDC057611]|uniref:beta-propeller fold lactonase family protein n=1 Tax=Streptomyces sp. NPDC057611 TaxID=3346182 RepID=UPI0036776FE2